MSGNLYVVATPIGNLEDLSPRARQTLADVDLIAAEDTRRTGRLLSHLGLKKRQIALHDHNEARVVAKLIAALESGQTVALVSDAGTPLVSDPGYRLVREAHQSGIKVSPIPGASAVTAALSAAGLPTDRFCFEGFLPAKEVARRARLAALATEQRTLVFFESVHRIGNSLADMAAAFGAERLAFIGREMTKMYEQCEQASLAELRTRFADDSIAGKGEFVIVVAGVEPEAESAVDTDRMLMELARVLPPRQAAEVTARLTGEPKNALYQRLLKGRGERE
jgi:16S rRNA (cytidine1402-2'-O)-methyltransferase